MHSRFLLILPVLALSVGLVHLASGHKPSGEAQCWEHVTPTFAVDKLYPSMKGPQYTNTDLLLQESSNPELLWVEGYEARMVGPDGKQPKPQQFMCHNTLSIHRGLDQHRQLFGSSVYGTRRLFTLSQGQYAVEFPKGFGIPILSSEKLMLQSQVLNLNENAIGDQVRHDVKTHFVRDADCVEPMKPLVLIPSGISVEVTDRCARIMPNDPQHLGCALDAGGGPLATAADGKRYTGHWVVMPSAEVEERHTVLPNYFPFDTTIHYIAAHVHPGCESFELRDRTTNLSIWTAEGTQADTGVGLNEISHYSSETGIPVFANHEYELVSRYHNHTGKEQSAMAFMFCYVLDKEFKRPTREALVRSDESFCTAPGIIR